MKPVPAAVREHWEASFEEQIARHAYNTAPVEAVVRTLSYYLRDRAPSGALPELHFLELGCGAGPNLIWLAEKGMRVSGVDITPTALTLARRNLERAGYRDRIGVFVESTVSDVPFRNGAFDGIVEACVFQHLAKGDRVKAFAEVKRLLKPGGVFVGYMLDAGHTVFQARQVDQLEDDPGTLILEEGGSRMYLTNIGLSHFYRKEELAALLDGFSVVDPCLTTYELPASEARKRGYTPYRQSMWTVLAIK